MCRLNAAAFGGALPETLAAVTWNAKLKTTAGLTYSSRVTGRSGPSYVARIELSRHVVDDAAKLRHTLAHEMCHAAAWIVRMCACLLVCGAHFRSLRVCRLTRTTSRRTGRRFASGLRA